MFWTFNNWMEGKNVIFRIQVLLNLNNNNNKRVLSNYEISLVVSLSHVYLFFVWDFTCIPWEHVEYTPLSFIFEIFKLFFFVVGFSKFSVQFFSTFFYFYFLVKCNFYWQIGNPNGHASTCRLVIAPSEARRRLTTSARTSVKKKKKELLNSSFAITPRTMRSTNDHKSHKVKERDGRNVIQAQKITSCSALFNTH